MLHSDDFLVPAHKKLKQKKKKKTEKKTKHNLWHLFSLTSLLFYVYNSNKYVEPEIKKK